MLFFVVLMIFFTKPLLKMKLNKIHIILSLTIIKSLFFSHLFSQEKISLKNYFSAPVDFTMTLSGNFGELRNNHFHSGIDIRTFTIGKKVYAVADGYISRIKISAGGYGKALYIEHPNGYTSVYGHLDHFSSEIEKFVKKYQYQNKTFEFDLTLDKNQFIITKRELIAFSGNTGSSAGPHLHFEIRDTKTEHPLNPLFLGFKIQDTTPPKIFKLFVYPLDSTSSVNGKNTRQQFQVINNNNNYNLKNASNLELNGNIGFALQTNDYFDNTWGKCGIYELKTEINDTLISHFRFNEFSFDESRYVNSHIDYDLYMNKQERIHKTFKEENNNLSIYLDLNNNGVYHFQKGHKYKVSFTVFDASKNKSNLSFNALGVEANTTFTHEKYNKYMLYSKTNNFSTEGLELKFPENSFYSNLRFQYSSEQDSIFLSPVHKIHHENVPVHNYYTLAIKPYNFPKEKSDKLLVVRIMKDKSIINEGGVYTDGWMKTKTSYFGNFAVTIDTVPPVIKEKNNFKTTDFTTKKTIDFKITDDLAGIQSYQGTIDGNWVLFEFDAKNDRLFYTFDSRRLQPQKKHLLSIKVTDKVGNLKIFESEFFW